MSSPPPIDARAKVLKLGREYSINPSAYLHEELEAVVGAGGVKLA